MNKFKYYYIIPSQGNSVAFRGFTRQDIKSPGYECYETYEGVLMYVKEGYSLKAESDNPIQMNGPK